MEIFLIILTIFIAVAVFFLIPSRYGRKEREHDDWRDNYECRYCNGRGEINGALGSLTPQKCPKCNGTGKK